MDVLDLTAELIGVPTPNPPGEERPLAERVARRLRAAGLEAEVLDVAGGTPAQANVLGRLRGTGSPPSPPNDAPASHHPDAGGASRAAPVTSRPPLVLCGHLDTVPPGEGAWSIDPYTATRRDGRLYGLGASDMKGAVAAMIAAAARLSQEAMAGRPLAADLILAFTSGEETRSLGARSFARSGAFAGAAGLVIGEPTGNRVGIAEKGGLWMDVILHGRTSHGSLPHLGANAVAGLAAVLSRFESGDGPATALREALTAPEHPLLGIPTLTPTRLSGGVASNVVPDRASATLDVRTLPGQSHAAIRAGIEAVLADVCAPRGLRWELVGAMERPALETPEDHPLVVACVEAVAATLGRPPDLCGLTGATDATELAPPLGLPFVICGPGEMAQAHQPDEFVAVEPLRAAVEIYHRLARTLCG